MKYCGYEIGKEITEEQVGRLFDVMHSNIEPDVFIALDDYELHLIAEEYKGEWW